MCVNNQPIRDQNTHRLSVCAGSYCRRREHRLVKVKALRNVQSYCVTCSSLWGGRSVRSIICNHDWTASLWHQLQHMDLILLPLCGESLSLQIQKELIQTSDWSGSGSVKQIRPTGTTTSTNASTHLQNYSTTSRKNRSGSTALREVFKPVLNSMLLITWRFETRLIHESNVQFSRVKERKSYWTFTEKQTEALVSRNKK